MKFCSYCGRQLNDDEVCTCPESSRVNPMQTQPADQNTQSYYSQPQGQPYAQPAQNPYSQQAYAQPAQNPYAQQNQAPYGQTQQSQAPYGQQAQNPYAQQGYGQNPYGQQPQNPYGQNPYGQPSQNPYGQNPYGQNPYGQGSQQQYRQPSQFSKKAKNIFSDFLDILKAFFKSPKAAVESCQKSGSFVIPGILTGIYAIATFLCTWLSLRSVVADMVSAYNKSGWGEKMKVSTAAKEIYNLPMLIIAGILSAAVLAVILIAFRLVMCKICGSNKGGFLEGFVAFSVYSIPSSAALLVGALLSFASMKIALLLSAVSFIYIVVSMLIDTAEANADALGSAKWVLIVPAVLIVALVLNSVLGFNILKLGLSDNMKDAMDKIVEGLGDISKTMY